MLLCFKAAPLLVRVQAQAFSPCLLHILSQGGADVALNTLTSSGMVAATLATLTPGATFVEISKRDIWSAARIAQGGGSLHWCTEQPP